MCLAFVGYVVLALIVGQVHLTLYANGHPCSEGFYLEAQRINITGYCQKKVLGAEFGWNYNNRTRRLDIVFGARLEGEMGWLAWGLNPEGPHMTGTRALIGIKHQNDSLQCHKYKITATTRIGCPLLPTEDLDLDIRNPRFHYLESIDYFAISATIYLPVQYNSSIAHIVWQIGHAVADDEPKMHPKALQNFDSAETTDLNSNDMMTDTYHYRRQLRTAHGVLNIVGWGTFLPIGVIIARYFRRFPRHWGLWFAFHVACQTVGYILGLSGWILGLWLGDKSKYYTFHTHRILGIIIFTFATIQIFALRLKPKPTDPYHDYWNMYHHFLGYALIAIISFNIFKGIAILKAESNWQWVYIGLLGLLATVALALEIYTWLKFYFVRDTGGKADDGKKQTSSADDGKKRTSSANKNAINSEIEQPQGSAGMGLSPEKVNSNVTIY